MNRLSEIDLEAKPDRPKYRHRRKRYAKGVKSRVAADVRKGTRKPPPVPKNKSMAEIHAMDPDDPAFRHVGRGRNDDRRTWKELARLDHVKRRRARRAKVRKWEAEVVVATQTMEKHVNSKERGMELYDEDRAIAEGILDLSDWDVEELVRGYRRSRNGTFSKPPKYIPREIQQAAFRALINRGDRRLKSAYYKALEELVDLAHSARSEKVKLDAIKEIENRVVGKVPDKVMVSRDEPWEDILADSLVPINESDPLELDVDDDGVARMPPVVLEREGEVGADAESPAASEFPSSGRAPSPSPNVTQLFEEVEEVPPSPEPRRRAKRSKNAARAKRKRGH